jgi:hypothetical protein
MDEAAKAMLERAIGDERHEFGSFFLSRLLGIEVAYEGDECVASFEAAPQLFNGPSAQASFRCRLDAGNEVAIFRAGQNRDCPLPRQLPEEGTQDILSAIIRIRRRRRNRRARDLDLEADLRASKRFKRLRNPAL